MEQLECRLVPANFSTMSGTGTLHLDGFADGSTVDVLKTGPQQIQITLAGTADVWQGTDNAPQGVSGDGQQTLTIDTGRYAGGLRIDSGTGDVNYDATLTVHGTGGNGAYPPIQADWSTSGKGGVVFTDGAGVFGGPVVVTAGGAITVDATLTLNDSLTLGAAGASDGSVLSGASLVMNANATVTVPGSLTVSGANLVPDFGSSTPPVGSTYTLFNDLGSDPVAGQFAGLPEGAYVTTVGGNDVHISYRGGDGNDVVLTSTPFDPPPTDVSLSASSVVETSPAGTPVGTLSSADASTTDSFSYALVPGTGGDDNAAFTISGDQLLTNTTFHHDTKSSYSVRVHTTDAEGKSFERAFTISVTDAPLTDTTPQQTLTAHATRDTGPVVLATFTDADPSATTGDFTGVSADWGDNSAPDTGVTVQLLTQDSTGTTFQVVGHHAYATTGSYTAHVTVTDAGGPQVSTTNTGFDVQEPLQQTITFAGLADRTYGDAAFDLSATASSGLPVSLHVVSGPATLSANTLTLTGAGKVTVEATQAGDPTYDPADPVDQSFTVNQAVLTVTADDAARLYGQANPGFTYHFSGFVNGDNATTAAITGTAALATTATATSPVSGSPYAITVDVSGLSAANYDFIGADGGLTINKAHLSVTADDKSRLYGAADPTFTYQITGFVNGEDVTSAGVTGRAALSTVATPTSPVYASPYAITVDVSKLSAANYDFQGVTGGLTIDRAHLIVTADNQERLYGQANPTFTYRISGFANGEGAASALVTGTAVLSTAATATSPVAGSPYAINVDVSGLAAPNYDFTGAGGQLTVDRAHLTVTPDNAARPYGQANPAFTYRISGFANGEDAAGAGVSGTPVLASGALPASPVADGPYAITADVSGMSAANYDFTAAVGQLTVTKAHLTVTAGNQARLYGQANPTLTYTISGFVNGEDATSAGITGAPTLTAHATPTSPVAGSPYAITADVRGLTAGNYDFRGASGQLTVSRAHLTVTADNQTRLYGQANPTLTYHISGFANGETTAGAGVTGTPVLATAATPTSPVAGSPYAITLDASGLSAANYDFTGVNGAVTVNKAHLTVTANDQARLYGQANPTLTYQIAGFVNGEDATAAGITGAPVVSTAATPASGVSALPYTVAADVSKLSAANYDFRGSDGHLTINKAHLTVTADDQARSYGEANPPLTYHLSGFVNGEDAAAAHIAGGPVLSTTATPTSAVSGGPYAITTGVSRLAAANYDFAGVAGRLTVSKADTTTTLSASATDLVPGQAVTFTAAVQHPGGVLPVDGGTVTFRDGDTVLAVVPVDPSTGSAALTLALDAGPHQVTAAYSGAAGYNGSTSSAAGLTVTTPPPVVAIATGDVTALVQVTLTPLLRGRKGKLGGSLEALTVTNNGAAPLQGPLNVVLRGLRSAIKVQGAAGFVGRGKKRIPFVVLSPAGGTLQPGDRITMTLRFSGKPGGVVPTVFAGVSPS